MPSDLPPLVADVLPEFAAELRLALDEVEEPGLAAQVASLRFFQGCGCGDDFCASFYTSPKPDGGWPRGLRNVAMGVGEGMVILDVVEEAIRYVEVLDRPDVKVQVTAIG